MEWSDNQKKNTKVEGSEQMRDLLKHMGKVLDTDSYDEAVEKISAALNLKNRENRTSAVYKLYNGHPQGTKTLDKWHKEMEKDSQAETIINWKVQQVVNKTSTHCA